MNRKVIPFAIMFVLMASLLTAGCTTVQPQQEPSAKSAKGKQQKSHKKKVKKQSSKKAVKAVQASPNEYYRNTHLQVTRNVSWINKNCPDDVLDWRNTHVRGAFFGAWRTVKERPWSEETEADWAAFDAIMCEHELAPWVYYEWQKIRYYKRYPSAYPRMSKPKGARPRFSTAWREQYYSRLSRVTKPAPCPKVKNYKNGQPGCQHCHQDPVIPSSCETTQEGN